MTDNPLNTEAGAQALREAELNFIRDGLRQSLTARLANRFYINVENDKISLIIGSIGTMAVGEAGQPVPPPSPVSDVITAVRVDPDFLRALVNVIGTVLPPAPTEEPQNG